MKLFYRSDVVEYFNHLIDILFEKQYFSSRESSKRYVLKIKNEINKTIHLKQTYKTPDQLKHYGLYYKKFTVSKGTTWVVIYVLIKDTYYINYITNNHAPDSQYIRGLK
jgi:hypothetical protein